MQPIMSNTPRFTVTYRGVTAAVEPANGSLRWEYSFSDDDTGDWRSLGIGNYPEVGIDVARARAVELCKLHRPGLLAGLYRERERLQKRIAELECG